MYYVYVIISLSCGSRYVGSTENVDRRVGEHNQGKCKYTSGRRYWKLFYTEEFKTRSEAVRRERFIKSGQGRKYLDIILSQSCGIV